MIRVKDEDTDTARKRVIWCYRAMAMDPLFIAILYRNRQYHSAVLGLRAGTTTTPWREGWPPLSIQPFTYFGTAPRGSSLVMEKENIECAQLMRTLVRGRRQG